MLTSQFTKGSPDLHTNSTKLFDLGHPLVNPHCLCLLGALIPSKDLTVRVEAHAPSLEGGRP